MKLKQILIEEEIDDGRKVIEKKDIRKELDNVGANKFKVIKQGKGSAISLEQSFEDFKQTMKFINDVAKIQTKLDHHGDISFNYDTVKLEIYSHTNMLDTNPISKPPYSSGTETPKNPILPAFRITVSVS